MALAAAFATVGCAILGPGYIGPIQPPVLDIPVMITDVRAVEYGDQIIAVFTVPKLSTEGQTLTTVRSVDLYAGPGGPGADDPNNWVKGATHYNVPGNMPGPHEYRFAAMAWVNKDVVLRARSTGPKGKQSLWSLPFVLNVTAPIAQPQAVSATSQKDGVRVTWRSPAGGTSAAKYRVMRATGAAMPETLTETDQPEYLDSSAQFGMTYQYQVLGFTDEKHQSLISAASAALDYKDVFPPEVPTGLTADAGVSSIELQWELNTEPDFKGYNVFRSVDNAAFVKVAALITAGAYHDADVQAGKAYRYQVSAVDQRDNESQRCAPVPAMLP